MRVILLQDIENLGKKYEVKEVKDGYARNFLLPKKLAKLATEKAMKWLENQKKKELEKIEQELKEYQELASKIDGSEIIIPVKIGKEGQLFEKIAPQKISEKINEQLNVKIKKEQINLEKPINELGEFLIKVSFKHNLEAEIKIIITEEKDQND